jgi:2'-5' RNA ligase
MKKYAIDVVVLPPDQIMDLAIDINRKLRNRIPENIVLSKTKYLPHISLLMGCVPAIALEDAFKMLESIASSHSTLDLNLAGITTVGHGPHSVVSFEIAATKPLQTLHESLVKTFTAHLSHDASRHDLADEPPIAESSLKWINEFIPKASFENFWPHITLGFGEQDFVVEHLSFSASRLAICHLGNHCTCARILYETQLHQAGISN